MTTVTVLTETSSRATVNGDMIANHRFPRQGSSARGLRRKRVNLGFALLACSAATLFHWLSYAPSFDSLAVLTSADEPENQNSPQFFESTAKNETNTAKSTDANLPAALVENATATIPAVQPEHQSAQQARNLPSIKMSEDLGQNLTAAPSSRAAAPPNANGELPDEFPERTVLGEFETKAAKEEARRHDRLIVEGMAYIASLTREDLNKWNLPNVSPSTVCINIMTSERKIPYIDALMMMLMRGQSPKELLSYARINLLNVERRPEHMEYRHFRNQLAKFPFVNAYNLTRDYPIDPKLSFKTTYRLNTITALDLCIQSELPYCLLMEDDAITPMNFIEHLDKYVIQEMNKPNFTGHSVSLLSMHSHQWTRDQLDVPGKYINSGRYDRERSKTNAELRHLGKPAYTPPYRLVQTKIPFGTVANMHSLEMAKKFREYLASFGNREEEGGKVLPAVDILMYKHTYFGSHSGLPRVKVEPSMVNHIGFYSEMHNVVSFKSSDVRFQLDAGE